MQKRKISTSCDSESPERTCGRSLVWSRTSACLTGVSNSVGFVILSSLLRIGLVFCISTLQQSREEFPISICSHYTVSLSSRWFTLLCMMPFFCSSSWGGECENLFWGTDEGGIMILPTGRQPSGHARGEHGLFPGERKSKILSRLPQRDIESGSQAKNNRLCLIHTLIVI